jgi:carbon monoxide dehydrogenase subunit G
MLHFDGTRDFVPSPSVVWARLTDARFLAQCIPGVESVKQADADAAECVLRPGFSFVRGTLELNLRVTDRVQDLSARILTHAKGIGSTSDVEATLRLSPQGTGTHLDWEADIKELGGLLKAVPKGLVQAAAQKVIADAWAAVEAGLAAP